MPIGSDSVADAPGVTVKGISDIVDEVVEDQDSVTDKLTKAEEVFQTTLAGHITSVYHTNKAARRESNIEREMIQSMYAVNMEYQADELAAIKTGSKIYMGLTATKSRAARSWIKDLIQPANEIPFQINPSPMEDLPEGIVTQVEKAFEEDKARLEKEIEEEFAKEQEVGQGRPNPAGPPAADGAPPPQEGQEQAPPPPKPSSALMAARKLKRTAELKRDVEEAIMSEISKIAKADIRRIERQVVDQLVEGDWDKALSDFIEDFTIYPTAFMKGPVVTTKNKLTWEGGKAVPTRQTVFTNQRVSPLDVYPSPSAKTIYDGDFCEHLRLTKKELSDLTFLKEEDNTGYKKRNIIKILEGDPSGINSSWVDAEIEEDKIRAEKRGSQSYASEGISHGLHFWGTASVKMLREWGYEEADLSEYEDYHEVEIEAILVGSLVIKCLINRDPLGRRPYYSASFQTRSGSLWGKSLPSLMRDIQRICNACARALSDNMGLSSGPQVGVVIDRLADDGPIESLFPGKIWQFTADPTGNGGKPIEFFMVPSNAQELLAVYDKFEIKADDVTGVPRYAYGNDNVGGAAQTAKGLSMLLESASKGIKGSIKNISEGLITPRVEYQFYVHLLNEMEKETPVKFSGDICIVVNAAEAITIKAAETELQKELLQAISATPMGMEVLGLEGYGDLLRKIFKGANLPEDSIPSRLELKERQAKQKFMAEQAQAQAAKEAEAANQVGVQATQIQVEGQKDMHRGTQETKMVELEQKAHDKSVDHSLKAAEIQQRTETEANKGVTKLQDTTQKLTAEGQNLDRKLAVDLAKSKQPVI